MGQKLLFDLEHFDLESGLPARMAYYVVEDLQGFIWLSTQNGIHRFDGIRYKNYSGKDLKIDSREVATLAVDGYDRIWYATLPGKHLTRCFVLDRNRDSILSVEEATGGLLSVQDLVAFYPSQNPGKGVLLTTKSGDLYEYKLGLKKIGRFNLATEGENYALRNANETYWLLGKKVLHRLQGQSQPETFHFKFPKGAPHIRSLAAIGEELFINFGDRRFGRMHKFSDGDWVAASLPNNQEETNTNIIFKSPDFWVYTTFDSIKVCDPEGHHLASFLAFTDDFLPPREKVKQVITDRQGNLWLPSEEGVFKLSVFRNPFETRFQGNSIYGIRVIGSRIWTTGNRDAIWSDLETEELARPPFHNVFRTIAVNKHGQIWITNRSKNLYRYSPSGDSHEIFDLPEIRQPNCSFLNPVTGEIWIAGWDGIYSLQETADTVLVTALWKHDEPSKVFVRHFHANREGIWVASSEGLLLLDALTGQCKRRIRVEDGLPGQDINYVYEDGNGNFWLATRGSGLILWNRKKESFKQFTMENGLSNNTIYAVYEDQRKTFWLPSDYGLMAFDPEKREVIRIYHKENGIAHEEFNTFSHCQDSSGKLYFGGLGGVTIFHPDDLTGESNGNESPILLSNIKVLKYGQEDYENRTGQYLNSGTITLDPDDQVLDMEISFLDFEQTKRNQIAYRLKGYQDSWVYPNEMRIILMNLPYGSYEIQIRARGASGSWTRYPLSIPIRILKPFYLRSWFFALMGLLLILVLIIAFRLRLRALRRDRSRLTREVHKRTSTITAQAEELKALDQAKSRFFANITHEIRTPLTLVIGPTEQLLIEEDISKVRRGMRMVLQNARSLLHLINQLLDISKLEHARMEVEPSQGDLIQFTRTVINRFSTQANQKEIGLSFHCPRDKWEVLLDYGKWEKILNNLISNAIKFTPEGREVMIRLHRVEEGAICLEVEDQGIGIPPEDLEKVFDRFHQVGDPVGNQSEGTGIGLALVKELIDLFSGTIRVESRLNKGTTFFIVMPALKESDWPLKIPHSIEREEYFHSEKESKTELFGGVSSDREAPRLSILLIEDNPQLRDFIRSCIDDRKYQLIEAQNGAEGIRKAMDMIPDLIISDIMMPEKDGFEVTRAIREHLATSHIPLILLTAKASLESKLEGLRRGADAYLTKPFSPTELNLRIGNLLGLRKLIQDHYRPSQDWETALTAKDPLPPELNAEESFMQELIAFIRSNLDNPDLKVQMITAHFGISRPHLYRKIAAITDSGISDLIRSARCERALGLILEGKSRMSEIAYLVGYSSPAHFSRSFKQQFGVSPSQVQKESAQFSST